LTGLWMTLSYPWPEADGIALYLMRLFFGTAMALAIVMGVAATSFTRFMPDSWTEHMKAGPGLVRLRAVEMLGGRGEMVIEELAANVVDPQEFLEAIYPSIIGREATPRELENWEAALTRGLCCDTVYFLATVQIYRSLAETKPVMPRVRPAPRALPTGPGSRWMVWCRVSTRPVMPRVASTARRETPCRSDSCCRWTVAMEGPFVRLRNPTAWQPRLGSAP